jgi:hypothetical protein
MTHVSRCISSPRHRGAALLAALCLLVTTVRSQGAAPNTLSVPMRATYSFRAADGSLEQRGNVAFLYVRLAKLDTFTPSVEQTTVTTGFDITTTQLTVECDAVVPSVEQAPIRPNEGRDEDTAPADIAILKSSTSITRERQDVERGTRAPGVIAIFDSTKANVKSSNASSTSSPESPRPTVSATLPGVTSHSLSASVDTLTLSPRNERLRSPADSRTEALTPQVDEDLRTTDPEVTSATSAQTQSSCAPSMSIEVSHPSLSREAKSPIPGLEATKAVSPEMVHVGETLHWVITIRNTTGNTLTLERIEDQLGPMLRFNSEASDRTESPQVSASESGSLLVWATRCDLAPGQTRRVAFDTTVMR